VRYSRQFRCRIRIKLIPFPHNRLRPTLHTHYPTNHQTTRCLPETTPPLARDPCAAGQGIKRRRPGTSAPPARDSRSVGQVPARRREGTWVPSATDPARRPPWNSAPPARRPSPSSSSISSLSSTSSTSSSALPSQGHDVSSKQQQGHNACVCFSNGNGDLDGGACRQVLRSCRSVRIDDRSRSRWAACGRRSRGTSPPYV
jgi:hypothetical protein